MGEQQHQYKSNKCASKLAVIFAGWEKAIYISTRCVRPQPNYKSIYELETSEQVVHEMHGYHMDFLKHFAKSENNFSNGLFLPVLKAFFVGSFWQNLILLVLFDEIWYLLKLLAILAFMFSFFVDLPFLLLISKICR